MMLSEIKRPSRFLGTTSVVNLLTLPTQSLNTFSAIEVTKKFNLECKQKVEYLRELTNRYNTQVRKTVANNPNYRESRKNGVKLAWKYEKADVEMGGSGSADWSKAQQEEIKRTGKVRGAEGHHQKNVADHPEEQANPDNIKFYKSKKEHLEKGHKGDWSNESDAPMQSKEKMLKRTNLKRVIKNELKGAAIASLIGFVTGASIGFIVSVAQNGISPESLKGAAIDGLKTGAEGAAFGLVNHIGARLVGDIATNAMTGWLSKLGVTVTENITKACNMGVVGSIAIMTFAVYQFVKLKREGVGTKQALGVVGKQALISVGCLAVTVVVQSVWGGPAAIAVSVGISAIVLSYSMYQMYHNKKLMEDIHKYSIAKSYPYF